jgi:hypothetical protein
VSQQNLVVVARDDEPLPALTIPPLRPIKPRRDRSRGGQRTAAGRYRNVDPRARLPANGLANSPSPNARLALAVVADPMERGASSIVTVNRQIDLVEHEYQQGRLTEGAYHEGRKIQRMFERVAAVGGSNWIGGDRIDARTAAANAHERRFQLAEQLKAEMARISKVVGTVGARRLRAHLVEGLTYRQAAEARGRSSKAAVGFAAESFRQLLEDLAEAGAATGASR